MKNCEILVNGKIRYKGKTYTMDEAIDAGIKMHTIKKALNIKRSIRHGQYVAHEYYFKNLK